MDNNNNMFDDLIPKQQSSSQQGQQGLFDDLVPGQQQPQPDTSNNGAFMAGVEAFNRQFGTLAENLLRRGLTAVGDTNDVNTLNAVSQANNQHLTQTSAGHPIATGIGSVIGAIGKYTPVIATGGASVLGQGLAGAAMGAAESNADTVGGRLIDAGESGIANAAGTAVGKGLGAAWDAGGLGAVLAPGVGGGVLGATLLPGDGSMKDRLTNAAMGGALAGTSMLALAGAGLAAKSIFGKTSNIINQVVAPQSAAEQDLKYWAKNQIDSAGTNPLETLDAAKRLNVNLNMSDAVGGNMMRGREASRILSDDQLAAQNTRFNQNTQNAENSLDQVIDSFTPQGKDLATKLKNEAYEKMKSINVGDDVVQKLRQDNNISAILDDFSSNKKGVMQDVPDNNLAKLDLVKQELDNTLRSDKPFYKDSIRSSLDANTKEGLMASKRNLTSLLDNVEITPGLPYQAVRKIAQQHIMQNEMSDLVNKSKEQGLKGYYNALFKGDKKEAFISDLQEAGGNVDQARDLITVLKSLSTSDMPKILAKNARNTTGSIPTSISDIVHKVFTTKAYDNAITEIMFNQNKWEPLIRDVMSAPKDQQPGKMLFMLEAVRKNKDALMNTENGQSLQDMYKAPQNIPYQVGLMNTVNNQNSNQQQ